MGQPGEDRVRDPDVGLDEVGGPLGPTCQCLVDRLMVALKVGAEGVPVPICREARRIGSRIDSRTATVISVMSRLSAAWDIRTWNSVSSSLKSVQPHGR